MQSESWASSPASRKVMQGNRSRDTATELAVRRIAHARGLRYRVNARPEKDVRRTADMVFVRAKVAVFIDGCFWHGCAEHHTIPKSNASYWAEKIVRNRERDLGTNTLLQQRGWTVVRYWEHEDPHAVVDSIERHVRG